MDVLTTIVESYLCTQAPKTDEVDKNLIWQLLVHVNCNEFHRKSVTITYSFGEMACHLKAKLQQWEI
jgi:hypothetical protein